MEGGASFSLGMGEWNGVHHLVLGWDEWIGIHEKIPLWLGGDMFNL